MIILRSPSSAVAALTLASVFVLVDCKCIDHPLYDKDVNRFDTYYLGGGNSQFRPFRAARIDDDAPFSVDLVVASVDADTVHLRAWIDAADPDAIEATLGTSDGREIGAFERNGDDMLDLAVDRDVLLDAAAGGDLRVELASEGGGGIALVVTLSDLRGAIAELEEVSS